LLFVPIIKGRKAGRKPPWGMKNAECKVQNAELTGCFTHSNYNLYICINRKRNGKAVPLCVYQETCTATTTRRPLSRVYSQVDRVISLSPYWGVMPVS